jgi:alanyl-tRNA synthetase
MGQDYPELARAEPLIAETLRREEVRFAETLERGLRLLADETERLGDGITLPGRIAFTLYDTYGFPLDLTQDVLRAQGRAVDTDGFAVAMAEQRAAARAAWAGSGEAAAESVWFEVRERVGATEFLGYATEAAEGQVLALVVDGAPVASAEDGVDLAVIVNQTPFYGESGGQAGDQGEIRLAGGARVAVHDTHKQAGDLVVHHGRLSGGRATVGEAAHLEIDHLRRSKLRAHHSVTHLLHEALRRTLGDHVAQKGSLVEADRMRFDFSHPKPITADERARVEDEVNRQIRANAAVETRLMSPDEATAAGALALFGEKYGEEVRVVAMGGDGDGFSVELCGGTHVARVGDIGFFRIVQESAVASGVRRIEAVAGAPAGRWIAERDGLLDQTAAVLKVAAGEVPERVKALVEERRRLEKELLDARKALAMAGGAGATAVAAPIRAVNGVPLTVRLVEGVPARELKGMAETVARDAGSGVVVIAATEEGRASLVVAVSADFTARVDAVRLVRAGAQAVGGKGGGGRADMAQAGGPDGARLADAIAAIEAELAA